MQIRFQPEAEAELAEACLWYAVQREGLDDELMQRVDEALQRIVDSPYAYQVVYHNFVARCCTNFLSRSFTVWLMTRFEYLRFITPAVIPIS